MPGARGSHTRQDPATPAWSHGWVDGGRCPAAQPWPLGAAQALAGVGRKAREDPLDPQRLTVPPDGLVAGHGHHVGLGPTLQPQTPLAVMPLHRVAGDPRVEHIRYQRALQQLLGQRRCGLAGDRGGNPRVLSALWVRHSSCGRETSPASQMHPLRLGYPRNIPIWLCSIVPAVPENWRATPADF
jgi:hypothetical protein